MGRRAIQVLGPIGLVLAAWAVLVFDVAVVSKLLGLPAEELRALVLPVRLFVITQS